MSFSDVVAVLDHGGSEYPHHHAHDARPFTGDAIMWTLLGHQPSDRSASL